MRFRLGSGIRHSRLKSCLRPSEHHSIRGKLLHLSVPVSPSVKWER